MTPLSRNVAPTKTCKLRGHIYDGTLVQCPHCRSISHALWMKKNGERMRGYRRAQYAQNKERVVQAAIQWRCENFDRYTQTRREREATSEYKDKAFSYRERNRELGVWNSMIQRCTNPKNPGYRDYGAKGVRVCKRWMIFRNFLADMGRRPSSKHTLDRIKNSKGYCPSNCRWATRAEQARNRTVNRMLQWNGRRQCAKDWADELGIPMQTLVARLDRLGWSVARTLTTGNMRPRRTVDTSEKP